MLSLKRNFGNYAFIECSLSSDAVCSFVGYFVTVFTFDLWITSQENSKLGAMLSLHRTYFTHCMFYSCFFNLIKLPKYGKCIKLLNTLYKGANKQAI